MHDKEDEGDFENGEEIWRRDLVHLIKESKFFRIEIEKEERGEEESRFSVTSFRELRGSIVSPEKRGKGYSPTSWIDAKSDAAVDLELVNTPPGGSRSQRFPSPPKKVRPNVGTAASLPHNLSTRGRRKGESGKRFYGDFLPAAKPAGHRTESVVLLVVVVVGVSLSPAGYLTEVHSKKTVLETETELPDILP